MSNSHSHNSIISLPDYIKPNCFLQAQVVGSCSKQFFSSDSQELYEKNKKMMPDTWEYHTTPVSYRFNSDGYRAPEFSTVDWKNSVVIFGCSMVFGEGLPEEYTIASQLQEILEIPVINMGLAGGSMMFSYYNQLMLHEIQPKPVAVVNVWSNTDRFCVFHQHGISHNGHWNSESDIVSRLSNTWNTAAHSYFIQRSASVLWKKIPYFECGFFQNTVELLNIKQLPITDFARDLSHPGMISMKSSAEIIARHLPASLLSCGSRRNK